MDIFRKYCVAGHTFSVRLPEGIGGERLLSSYVPFRKEDSPCQENDGEIFSLDVEAGQLPATGELVRRFNDSAPYIWVFRQTGGMFSFGFSHSQDAPAGLMVLDGTRARLHIRKEAGTTEIDNAVNNALMLMYTYSTGRLQTLMMHASVSVKDGMGYVFLGKSGTGKSTHSRMWMENIPQVWLLNDDNPVMRIIDGKACVFGTPWSGKTPCYKNECVPVQAIVRLEQYPENIIRRLSPIEAYAALMPSCSSMKWDSEWADAQHATLEKVIATVGCWHLRCLPDGGAAHLCHKTCRPQ